MERHRIEIPVPTSRSDQVDELRRAPFDDTDQRILDSLLAFCPQAYADTREMEWERTRHWTSTIRRALWDLGTGQGFLVYPSEKGGGWRGEWLFDLVWVEAETGDWQTTCRLLLACECEWAATECSVLHDFYKLIFSQASYRLFIYTNKPLRGPTPRRHPADACISAIQRQSREGDRYLLVGYPRYGAKDSWLRVDRYCHEMLSKGCPRSYSKGPLAFKALPKRPRSKCLSDSQHFRCDPVLDTPHFLGSCHIT